MDPYSWSELAEDLRRSPKEMALFVATSCFLGGISGTASFGAVSLLSGFCVVVGVHGQFNRSKRNPAVFWFAICPFVFLSSTFSGGLFTGISCFFLSGATFQLGRMVATTFLMASLLLARRMSKRHKIKNPDSDD